MTELDNWLKLATRQLSQGAAAQVRTEIQEHYDSELEAAIDRGSSVEEANRLAVAALGDAKDVNCQYRRVLLTAAEARMLRESNWEARAICSRPWLKLSLQAIPGIALLASLAFWLGGAPEIARALVAGGIGMAFLFIGPFLPIYTPSRGRIFRIVKWISLTGAVALAFRMDAPLFASCMWPLIWIESTRSSIRRKLRVADWPKQLHL